MAANPVVEWVQPRRPFTRDDLERMPDDGHRYEIVDGTLIVTPAPAEDHQDAVIELLVRLRSVCPPELKVLVAPFAVVLGVDTEVQPDLLVVRRSERPRKLLQGPPELAVEVLSPSTRHVDLGLKRSRFEAAGCPAYWVVDPRVPSIVAWQLDDGAYRGVARASGSEGLMLDQPFPVAISPSDLVV